jgi:hypothetical protein
VLIADDPPLLAALEALAREGRLVFFAGLPGTGKSLLLHQLAHLAHARGRRLHLLQWDVARPVFEASEAGRRYPLEGGVTHGVIRLAVGRWAHLEAERERRAREPLHPREREDAPSAVLRALWRDLAGADIAYDPVLYQRAYERLLRHRRAAALPLHARLRTQGMSAYEFAIDAADLLPTPGDIERAIREVETTYPAPEDAIDGWRRPA